MAAILQSPQSQFESLKALVLSSLDAYEQNLKRANHPYPSFDEAHPTDDPFYLPSHEEYDTRNRLVGALGTLKALVESPAHQLQYKYNTGHHLTSCLDVFVQKDIAQLLETAGPAGLPASEIAKQTNLETGKLTRILRYLAINFVIKETSTGTFASNRWTRFLLKGNPTRGLVLYSCAVGLPSASEFRTAVTDPRYSHSYDQAENPCGIHFDWKTNGYHNMYEWLGRSNPELLGQFATAMQSFSTSHNPAYVADFPWDEYKGWTVVDLGGGNGSLLLDIMKGHPHLKGSVQDRPETVALAKTFWEANYPEAIKDGRIAFENVDFFKEQPRKEDNTVFIMRHILHNYASELSIQILKVIAANISPKARVLVVEYIMPTAVEVPSSSPAYPLLEGNSTEVSYGYDVDMWMLYSLSAEERTQGQFEQLAAAAGLEAVKLHVPRGPWGILELKLKQ